MKFTAVYRFLKGYIRYFVLSFIFACLVTVFSALIPQIIRYCVDHVLVAGEETAYSVPLCAAAAAAAALLGALFSYLSKYYLADASEGYLKAMRDALYRHISVLPYAWFSDHPTGDIIQRCLTDVDAIRSFVCVQLPDVLRIGFLILFYLFMMFRMDVRLALIVTAFIPVIIGYSFLFYFKIATRFLAADEAEGDLSAAVQENLTGVRVVRAFGREAFEIDRFDQKNNIFASLWIRLGSVLSAFWASGDLITGLQAAAVLTFGTAAAVSGRISLGSFLAFCSYNAALAWPVRSLGRILSEMSKAGVSIERINEILDSAPEEDPGRKLTPDLNGDIVFDHVTFSYPGSAQPVLSDVSFTIPGGSTFGILGSTGSGKSTLLHLLGRMYTLAPSDGKITISGVDIRDIELSHLRRHFALVLQEPFLYSRSVLENITMTAENTALSQQAKLCSAIACVDDAIEQFPDKYETIVGERGVTLSGGQKQRVAIAQALMKDAPIIAFDDSLSAVDTQTDRRIREALNAHLTDRTVMLISHRINTLQNSDRILVLEHGKVSAVGTHKQLIRIPGLYRSVWEIQQQSLEEAYAES